MRAPLVELAILEPDRSRCMVLAITELKASLKSGGSGLTINALLGGIKLARSNVALIETRGDARAADAAVVGAVAVAICALAQPACRSKHTALRQALMQHDRVT